jgi:serine/threonine-protein kinase 24/25/MST4
MFISFCVPSITVIGRERPKFAAKSMDATQNGQTHDEEEDFGTGTIKVNRTKDTAPSLRYI